MRAASGVLRKIRGIPFDRLARGRQWNPWILPLFDNLLHSLTSL